MLEVSMWEMLEEGEGKMCFVTVVAEGFLLLLSA